MKMEINVLSRQVDLRRAQMKVLISKYANRPSVFALCFAMAAIVYYMLVRHQTVDKVAALPLAIYAPIIVLYTVFHILRLIKRRDLPTYQIDIDGTAVSFQNLSNVTEDHLTAPVTVDIKQIENIEKTEGGYILTFVKTGLNELDDATFRALEAMSLVKFDTPEAYIFVPRMSFETYYALKRFDRWLNDCQLVA
ncbi:MAG: hypothetical protein PWP51_3039 [Clostridiales bacterium]|jgi:hypothetical protein|nr:hypothetical protein [Clostridiales bacterium]MDN5300486.1 hypothetical protein [Clostridiales bacterium]